MAPPPHMALHGSGSSGIAGGPPPPVMGGSMFGGPIQPYQRGPPKEYLQAINKANREDVEDVSHECSPSLVGS
jgi:hypothetical protein